jgi:membrane fusion protein, multidrug efflux system
MKPIRQQLMRLRPLSAALALASIAGVAGLGLAGCEDANGKAASAMPAATQVSAARVTERDVLETQEFSGRMEAIDSVEIRSRVSGYITAINFKPGSQVRKGDLLFVIDTRPYQAEADRAEAGAAAAGAKADLARLELKRAELLLADKAIAQREYDEKASGVKELDANARAAKAQLEAARLNVAYTRVLAPIDGRVSKAEITLGNLVDASALLTSVVSTERIYASFDGDEDTYLRVARQAQQGKPVSVKVGLANESGFPHEGRLEFVDNRLDTRTGSVRMRATFTNADNALVPGLFARVQISGGDGQLGKSRALLVNDRAIGTDQDRKFVIVVGADGKAEYRPVKLGALFDGLRMVRDGLKPGETVVVTGLQRVRAGDALAATMVAMEHDPAKAAAKHALNSVSSGTAKE